MRRNISMQTELTNHCNFKCTYCPHSLYGDDAGPSGNPFNRPKGFMSQELMEKCIKAAVDHAKNLTIGFFGEQQLHKSFDRYVKAIPSRGKRKFPLIINSNWSLVTEETVPALMRFDMIRISIDSIHADRWEKLCPGSDLLMPDGSKGASRYGTLLAKVKWWLKKPNRPNTNLIFVTQEENEDEVEAFVAQFRQYLTPRDAIVTKSILTYGGVVFDPYMIENKCNVANQNRFTVAWDGRCTPCNLDVNLGMATHNLLDKTVPEILDSPEWAVTLQGIRDRIGICANCFDAQNHSQTVHRRSGSTPMRVVPVKVKGKPLSERS